MLKSASESQVPDPPDFSQLVPAIDRWPAGTDFVRVFSHRYPVTAFNAGSGTPVAKGRFHFFADGGGRVIPVMYGAAQEFAALAETVFHDVPISGTSRVVFESRLGSLSIGRLQPTRDLCLVSLHGFGLHRLSLRAQNLTDTNASDYPRTIEWARTLHAALPDIDGLAWMSRQFNSSLALILFGDRVSAADLAVSAPPVPLLTGRGRDLVDSAANAAGIAVVR